MTKHDLRNYVELFLGVKLQTYSIVEGHSNSLDYIWYSFSIDFLKQPKSNADCVVWANRGGGKTQSAAILTLLDCLFKPEIQIRILSGSGFQAGILYDYFNGYATDVYSDLIEDVKTWPTKKTIFKNGAVVEVLVQSETSVRGPHVHKLRCDEVELFKPKVYEAAQYTTMSSKGYTAALEVISTMHKENGLMRKLVKEAEEFKRRIFKWNIWDVIESCRRMCSSCELNECCGGQARRGKGYFRINDVITQLSRTKRHSFNMEMLCGEGSKKKFGWNFGWRKY